MSMESAAGQPRSGGSEVVRLPIDPAPLTVSTSDENAVRRISAAGEIDISTAPILRSPLVEAVREAESVVVDLTEVTFMDSHGLRVLIEARVAADDKPFVVAAASPNVRRLINLSGLGETFGLPAHQ